MNQLKTVTPLTFDPTKWQMIDEIRNELSQGVDLETIRDRAGEIVDSYLPVYYNQIMEEWAKMPSEYNDRGAAELGHMDEVTIYGLMSLDLYLYYSDILTDAFQWVEEHLEGGK